MRTRLQTESGGGVVVSSLGGAVATLRDIAQRCAAAAEILAPLAGELPSAAAAVIDQEPESLAPVRRQKALPAPKAKRGRRAAKVEPVKRTRRGRTSEATIAKIRELAALGSLSTNQIAEKAGCTWATAAKHAKGVKPSGNGSAPPAAAAAAPGKRPWI